MQDVLTASAKGSGRAAYRQFPLSAFEGLLDSVGCQRQPENPGARGVEYGICDRRPYGNNRRLASTLGPISSFFTRIVSISGSHENRGSS